MVRRFCGFITIVIAVAAACETSVPSMAPPPSSAPAPRPTASRTAQPTGGSPAPTTTIGWVAAAPLHQARREHTATVLADGRVLVAGGFQEIISPEGEDQTQILSSVEVFLPGAGRWKPGPPMPQPRSGHEAILLADGRLLVFGGRATSYPSAEPATKAALFNPASNRWRVVDGPSIASPTGAVLLPDGRVLTVGLNSDSNPTAQAVAIFDPSTLKWQRGTNHPGAWYRPALTVLIDGSVLVAGGLYPRAPEPSTVTESWRYDPIADRWERTGDLIESPLGGSAVRLPDRRVLLLASFVSNVFDPTAGTWATLAPPLHDRMGYGMIALADGRVLATGRASCFIDHDATELYDPATDRWLTVEAVTERSDGTLTLLADGRAMLVGGVLECGAPGVPAVALRDVEILDPARIH
jgi:N-acetylneuraminic acid mutarotase